MKLVFAKLLWNLGLREFTEEEKEKLHERGESYKRPWEENKQENDD